MTPARLLDLTRTFRRVGRTVTGVDRVERAYLQYLLEDPVPLFGLVRTALGYVLLDEEGLSAFQRQISGSNAWGPADLLSRLPRGRDEVLQRAESDLRRLAIARRPAFALTGLLRQRLPTGFVYFNVGHSNLTARVMGAVKAAGGRVEILLHDVIPLEFPQFQRPETVAPFRGRVARVGRWADRVIYNSHDTQERAEAKLAEMGRVPPGIVSHLGTIAPESEPDALPNGLPPVAPYFITVGTIEPRKNHAFLLDLWEEMGPNAPTLLICGSRGWENRDVFDRLDRLSPDSPIRELSDLSDGAIASLLENSAGALFPTLAEGFGLPQVEAATLGARVLCNDLTVLREIMGSNARYIPVKRPEIWLNTIKEWEKDRTGRIEGTAKVGYSWPDHFKTVLRLR